MNKRERGLFLESICKIVAMLNLYNIGLEYADQEYLNTKSAKVRKKSSDDITFANSSIQNMIDVLSFLEPFMEENDIHIYLDDSNEFYVVYKNRPVSIDYSEALSYNIDKDKETENDE